MAALINAGVPGLPRQLTGRVAKVAASLGAAGELVADKLPSAPDRLEPAGLGGRIVLAAAAGAVLARGAKDPLLPAVVVAAAAALLSARVPVTMSGLPLPSGCLPRPPRRPRTWWHSAWPPPPPVPDCHGFHCLRRNEMNDQSARIAALIQGASETHHTV